MQRTFLSVLLFGALMPCVCSALATEAVLAGVWPVTTTQKIEEAGARPTLDRYGRTKVMADQQALLAAGRVVMDGSIENARWRAAEHEARGARLGLWQKLPLLAAETAEGHAGSFVLVQGRVTGTYQSREDLYLNFGSDWKTDFTLRIPRRYWKKFPDAQRLTGKKLEARGVLYERNGPMITLQFPGQMVVVE